MNGCVPCRAWGIPVQVCPAVCACVRREEKGKCEEVCVFLGVFIYSGPRRCICLSDKICVFSQFVKNRDDAHPVMHSTSYFCVQHNSCRTLKSHDEQALILCPALCYSVAFELVLREQHGADLLRVILSNSEEVKYPGRRKRAPKHW